jgi:ATP-dependent Lon protease
VIREDLAFLDRLHFYIPGWEIPKMRNEFFTDHYGFVVDYLAEALKELRKENYAEVLDRNFALGNHLNARDAKAVRKTVSGLLKLIYPHLEFTREELAEILSIALEGRRRVKEQLKKMGAFEYHQTSFSYVDRETSQEHFVGVPEGGGRALLSQDPLEPGSVYAGGASSDGKVGLYRIEVGVMPGMGKLRIDGGIEGSMKECVQRAFAYLQSHKAQHGVGALVDTTDFHVEAIDLLSSRVAIEPGIAVLVAMHSALHKRTVLPALVIVGDLSIQGNIKPPTTLSELLQTAMENGARRVLVPVESKRTLLEVPADVIANVDPIFFADPGSSVLKAMHIP